MPARRTRGLRCTYLRTNDDSSSAALEVRRVFTALSLLLSASVGIAANGTAGAANSEAPSALAATVILNAKSELAVRVTSSLTLGAKTISIVTNAARLYGEQKITIRQSGATNTVTAELIDNIIYVKGDAAILESLMGLSKSTATKFSKQWFYIKDGSAEYDEVAQGLTIASGISEVALQKRVTSPGTKVLDGAKVSVLVGSTVPGAGPTYRETMYASSLKKPLPVEVIQTLKGEATTIRFSKWDENFSITAPDAKFQLT
jgi:hypothetical protein